MNQYADREPYLSHRCAQTSPLPMLTEERCYRPAGHPPPHRFTSLDPDRTDLEQFPTAKELAR